jgi:hypothetical protein
MLGDLGELLCTGVELEGVGEGHGAAPTAVPTLTWGRGPPPSNVERILREGEGEAAARVADGSGDGAAAAELHTCGGVSMNDTSSSGSVTVAAVGCGDKDANGRREDVPTARHSAGAASVRVTRGLPAPPAMAAAVAAAAVGVGEGDVDERARGLGLYWVDSLAGLDGLQRVWLVE